MSTERTHWNLGEVLPNGATVVVCHYDENGDSGTVLARTGYGEYASWTIEIATGLTFRGDYYGTDLAKAVVALNARDRR